LERSCSRETWLRIDDIVDGSEDLRISGSKTVVGCFRRSLLRVLIDAMVDSGEDFVMEDEYLVLARKVESWCRPFQTWLDLE
jgi:hypothetical protein